MTPQPDKTITVAIADDHPILRQGLIGIINGFEGIEIVAEAGNGRELTEKIATLDKRPHIVILDINMPVMDGYETAKLLREKWPELKIIALSLFDSEEYIIRMLRSGANGYLLKDCEPRQLQSALNALMEQDFYISDVVTGKLLKRIHMPETERLTTREEEFLKLCCCELTYKEIAEKMLVSPRTVDGYRESLFTKLDVTSRVGLVIYSIRNGLVKV